MLELSVGGEPQEDCTKKNRASTVSLIAPQDPAWQVGEELFSVHNAWDGVSVAGQAVTWMCARGSNRDTCCYTAMLAWTLISEM